jgi:hypothetical protein
VKTLRRISAVTVLSLTLAVTAFAGHMDTTGAPVPRPRPDESSSSTTTDDVTTYIILTITSLIYL